MLSSGDERQILNLLHRYAELVDAGDFDGVSRLFASARVHMAGPDRPSLPGEMLGATMKRVVLLYDGVPRTRHVVTNTIVEPDGDDGATTRSVFTVTQEVAPSFPLQVVASGRYHDRFVRTDGTWAFTERTILFDHRGDTSMHLRTGADS